MRRLLRFLFVWIMSALTFAPLLALFNMGKHSQSHFLVFIAGVTLSIISAFFGCKFMNKDEPVLFWITFVPLTVCLAVFAVVGGLFARAFFSSIFFDYFKIVTMGAIMLFWYGISTQIIKLSREERIRMTETPSETALRHAREHRDPAFDIAERERLEKMLAQLPEKERQELLRKQAEYEARQNKE